MGNCRTEGRPSGACPCGRGSCPRRAYGEAMGLTKSPRGLDGGGAQGRPPCAWVRLKVNPHDYIHGGCWPFELERKCVCKGSAHSGRRPMPRLLVGVPSRGPSPRPSACGPRQPLDGVGPIWSASALTAQARCARRLAAPPRYLASCLGIDKQLAETG